MTAVLRTGAIYDSSWLCITLRVKPIYAKPLVGNLQLMCTVTLKV